MTDSIPIDQHAINEYEKHESLLDKALLRLLSCIHVRNIGIEVRWNDDGIIIYYERKLRFDSKNIKTALAE